MSDAVNDFSRAILNYNECIRKHNSNDNTFQENILKLAIVYFTLIILEFFFLPFYILAFVIFSVYISVMFRFQFNLNRFQNS